MARDETIRERLRLGEDDEWEFKEVAFSGTRVESPKRDSLAAEVVAFANKNGGRLLLGVTDAGALQGLSREQMDELDRLLVSVGADIVRPRLQIEVHRRELDGKALILAVVPQGRAAHQFKGQGWIRIGSSRRKMSPGDVRRLERRRAQSQRLGYDEHPWAGTGINSLDRALWRPILSAQGREEPEAGLEKLGLLAEDESGAQCATVAGLLLCAQHPQQWLPGAAISAVRYRGTDRTTGQFDAREITGPLQRQVADAMNFVHRNMRVAARKTPARIDMPQYSLKAVFEAVVNAVVHRDYEIRGGRIRLSMFSDRLEVQSPGTLPNSLTIESMPDRQSTRNQVIASAMGKMGVGEIRGSEHRRHFMEQRGDGVRTIIRETRELSGRVPKYRMIDNEEVLLSIPAAPQDPTPSRVEVVARMSGRPLPGANILAVFPNGTWKQAITDERGKGALDLYTTELPMTVYGAAAGCAAFLLRGWLPSTGEPLELELAPLPRGGSVIFAEATGHVPGLRGRLSPILDAQDRTYIYASNIAVDRGLPQPVHFALGETLRLTDANGVARDVRIIEIIGRSALVEYRAPEE